MTDFSLTHRVIQPSAGTPPHPGLLLLHGRGADETDLLPLGPAIDPRLFVVSARAPFHFPYGGYGWYALAPEGVGYPDPSTLNQSLELLQTLLDQILAACPIDAARVYAAGFSMGSVMAGTLGLLIPERVAGAAILSGYLPIHSDINWRPNDATGHPYFQAHGTLDDVIPVRFGRETRDYLLQTPVDLTYREYREGHAIGGEELTDLRAWMKGVLDDTGDPSHEVSSP